MASADGATQHINEIPSERVLAVAVELGIDARRLEDWRDRGLVPKPRRVGSEGRRPRWLYPPHTEQQLRAAVRWRSTTRDFDSIKIGLWADGFPIELETVRASLLSLVDQFQAALAKEVARITPTGEAALGDRAALEQGLAAYADDLARRRSRQPFKRTVRLSLPERQRAFLYMLAPLFQLEPNPDDAGLAEKLYGIARGRSGTAGGALPDTPDAYVGFRPLSAVEMREAINAADALTFRFVQGSLEAFLKLAPALIPFLYSSNPGLGGFLENARELLDEMPAAVIALFAIVQITNTERQRAVQELTPEIVAAFRPETLLPALFEVLTPDERKAFLEGINSANT
jgi:hypothetical protein